VNVEHLQLMTPADHTRLHRSELVIVRNGNSLKTHCVHGHEFTPENTYITSAGHRRCQACHRRSALQAKQRAPEHVREINRRATKRYLAKKRAAARMAEGQS
jgi:hypothetical protein